VSVSEIFASFVEKTRFEDLPEEVIDKTKLHIIDTIAATFAGSESPLCKVLKNYASTTEKIQESTIIASGGLKVSSPMAAMINGVAAHALEIDDGHRYCGCHPGCVVVPAALATAEKENASGKDLILAVCLGYEVMIKVGWAINPSHLSRGFHTTGTAGVFGAAVASGKIMNLSKKELKHALGIAGIQSSGLLEVVNSGQMIKPLIPGRAAQSGVLSAILAREGVEGPDSIFEGEKGFFRAMSGDLRENNLSDLGKPFEISNSYFKFYTACRHIHPAIDAARSIREKYGKMLTKENITKIIIKTYPVAVSLTGNIRKPKTFEEAKFSLTYAVSQELLGKMMYENYNPRDFEIDEEVLELCEKCEVISDPSEGENYPKKRGATVEVHLKSHEKVLRSKVGLPIGEPENPSGEWRIIQKFKRCCHVKGGSVVDRLVSTLLKLEELEDIKGLTKYL